MKRVSFAGFLAVALSILGTHSAAAQTSRAFMLVPGIQGESEADGRFGWIDVLSVSQLFTGVEKKTGDCVASVAKVVDGSTPLLFAAAARGDMFREVRH